MKLGVVIVTYNRKKLLKECIEACIQQTYKFDSIIVINNNSNDGTEEYLNTLKNANIFVKNLDNNIGGAGGFYEGVKVATNMDLDYLLLIDDDAIIENNFNEEIIKNLNDNILAYSGTVKTNKSIQYDHRKYLLKNFKSIDSKKEDYINKYFDYELSSFCGLYISVELIKKIGLPKKEFFIWFDDTEYSLRISKNTKIRNINSAVLNHKTKDSRDSGYTWKSYYGLRNQIYILKKYFSSKSYFKYIINLKFMQIASRILSLLKKDNYYLKVSNMYKDALKDGINNNLGKNEKYIPGIIFEKKVRE